MSGKSSVVSVRCVTSAAGLCGSVADSAVTKKGQCLGSSPLSPTYTDYGVVNLLKSPEQWKLQKVVCHSL